MQNSNQQPSDRHEAGSRKPSFWRALLKYGIPLVVSVGLCYLLMTGVDFDQMIEIVRRDCNFNWILLAMAISILSHVFRAMRWQIQLRALDIRAPLFYLVLSIFGTYAVNLVLPRLGELWRTGYIANRQKASFATVFGSMVADRLADTITVLLLTLVTFLLASSQIGDYLSQSSGTMASIVDMLSSPWLWIGVVAVIALIWYLFRAHPDNRIIARISTFVRKLWQGFAVVVTMPGKCRWLLLTICIWGCYFLQLYVAFFAFPATTEVVARYGIIAVLVCFVLSSISMGVPSNGGIGPWQWAIIVGLGMYSAGIPALTDDYKASFANLVMGSQTLLLIVLGLFTFITIALTKRRNSHGS